ncbi:NmrA family NAD(P)-binding protein [Mesorhizobium sp. B2-1-8]|uniref:NmrA family NAD(P)-binding protein n=1 Tax=Mesorhizobium sp. B2-1-8 TaxID=2589967 RepID=UPI00112D1F4B|nr:NmrA family NAD(P)-binding protein [Mesorhizobium sp. B2-1-8]UCI17899.1 NmrA family NAD(P)-binding protein [Mesorhizobium sp. B2-1-8]
MTNKILVTGAAGHTGGYTIEALLAKRHNDIRALVRLDDDRAKALRERGVEIVVGNLLDLDAVRAALKDVDAAYFVYPIEPGLIQATAYFAQAAKEASVKAIVNMSQKSARSDATSHAAQDHWIGERVFDWSGIPTTHLRPTFFTDWLLYPYQMASIRQGKLRTPFGIDKHAPIAAEDQGRVIAAILLDPEGHAGQTYPLYGPVELTQSEVAGVLSKVLGRTIEFEPVSLEQFRLDVEQQLKRPFLAQHLYEVARDHGNGVFAGTNDIVRSITGSEAMSVEDFVQANRVEFELAS